MALTNPNWLQLLIKGLGAVAISDGINVLGINADGSINTTVSLGSPTVIVGNVGLVPGTILNLSSPTVIAGDVTIHGTVDVQDRVARQLGLVGFTAPQHVIVDSQPPITTQASSPQVISGSVGLVPDTTIVDQQMPGVSGSPWVVAGRVDASDSQVIIRSGQVSIQGIVPIIGHVIVDSQPAITLASPVTVAGSVGLVPDTTVVAQQIPGFSGSPWVVTGTVAVVPGIAGQLVMSASQPVVIASDQSAVTVRQLAVSSPWVRRRRPSRSATPDRRSWSAGARPAARSTT